MSESGRVPSCGDCDCDPCLCSDLGLFGKTRQGLSWCPCCGRYAIERPGNVLCMGCAQYGCGDIDAEPCQLTRTVPASTPAPEGTP